MENICCRKCGETKHYTKFNKTTTGGGRVMTPEGYEVHCTCQSCAREGAARNNEAKKLALSKMGLGTSALYDGTWLSRWTKQERKVMIAEAAAELLASNVVPIKYTKTTVASLNYDRDDTDYLYPGLKERRANRVKRYTPVDREDQEKAKDGQIYVITNPAWPGLCKIGETTDLKERLKQFQTSSPYRDYEVAFELYVEDRKAMEKAVHNALLERGLNEKGEWFHINQWHAENLIYKVKRDSQKENDNAHTNSRHRSQRVPPCSGHDLAG